MATTTDVPIETYLRTEYEPDCEYVDGEIEERPVPEYDHSTWQEAMLAFFREHGKQWGVRARAELRVQVSPTRYRVADVTVLSRSAAVEQIVVAAPLAVFEILSPENTLVRMMEKFADYERMGVPGIWIIEPKKPILYSYASGRLENARALGLPTLGITFTLEDIAAFLD